MTIWLFLIVYVTNFIWFWLYFCYRLCCHWTPTYKRGSPSLLWYGYWLAPVSSCLALCWSSSLTHDWKIVCFSILLNAWSHTVFSYLSFFLSTLWETMVWMWLLFKMNRIFFFWFSGFVIGNELINYCTTPDLKSCYFYKGRYGNKYIYVTPLGFPLTTCSKRWMIMYTYKREHCRKCFLALSDLLKRKAIYFSSLRNHCTVI